MNMSSWHSYPSIYNLGHRSIQDLLTVPVNVEEKIDGSQFSFGVDEGGEIHCRSKGAKLHVFAPEKMFERAVALVLDLVRDDLLQTGWNYSGEYLAKPKHNTLAYNRAPTCNVIIFDIRTGEEYYLPYAEKRAECERIGLECVPLIYSGRVLDMAAFRTFLDRESVLGGQKVEGVVVKPADYGLFGQDKKVLMGKFVSEAFKEVHGGEWRKSNPTNKDILDALGNDYRTPARWDKALLHLREGGAIQDSPRDIGALIKGVPVDIEKECREEIEAKLWAWAWPHIRRKVCAGLPEWYKEKLLAKQFETPE